MLSCLCCRTVQQYALDWLQLSVSLSPFSQTTWQNFVQKWLLHSTIDIPIVIEIDEVLLFQFLQSEFLQIEHRLFDLKHICVVCVPNHVQNLACLA